MRKQKTIFILYLLAFLYSESTAQSGQNFSLKNAIQYGIKNNRAIKKSGLDVEKNRYQFMEALSSYMPQANGSVSVIDNLKLQTSILPGEVFGQPGEQVSVQFGTKFNVTAGIEINQTILDASKIYGIKASNDAKGLTLLKNQKTQEQTIYDIAVAYYGAEIAEIQKGIIEANLSKIDSMIKITNAQFQNGFAKKVDLDRLLISRTNTKTEIEKVTLNYQNQILLLKYIISMPLDSHIVLEKNEYQASTNLDYNNNYERNTDILLLRKQNDLSKTKLMQINLGYAPTISFGYKYAYQVQQNDLRIFSNNAKWFPNSYLSFNLNIPILDGGNKYARATQVKIEMKQNKLDEQNTMQNLAYLAAKSNNNLVQNKSSLGVQKNNIQLAEEVYAISQNQFKGGIGSMSDLLNAETALKEAQINYLNELVQIKLAELEILKTSGNLNNLIK